MSLCHYWVNVYSCSFLDLSEATTNYIIKAQVSYPVLYSLDSFPISFPCSHFFSLWSYKTTEVNGASILYPQSPIPWLWKLDLINILRSTDLYSYPWRRERSLLSHSYLAFLCVIRSFCVVQKISPGEKTLTLRSTFPLLWCPPHIHLDWLPTIACKPLHIKFQNRDKSANMK